MASDNAVTAPAKYYELQDQFLRIVCADARLVREEFDALIAAVWGDGHQPESDRGAADPPTTPPRDADPRLASPKERIQPADPHIGHFSRERSPP
jgi:hypothetical protein